LSFLPKKGAVKMKQASTKDPIANLKSNRGYATALEQLEKLKPALEGASRRLEVLTNRASRSSSVKQYLSRAVSVMPQMTEPEFDAIARAVAANGAIQDELMKQLRLRAPRPRFTDQEDLALIDEVSDAIRAVELFKRAITLQEREISLHKKSAIGEVCKSVQGERERIGRRVAEAALNLVDAVVEEKKFLDGLISQDPAIPASLTLPPFPGGVQLSDLATRRWIGSALGIDDDEVTARIADLSFPAVGAGR
jgi:hypothetical protein